MKLSKEDRQKIVEHMSKELTQGELLEVLNWAFTDYVSDNNTVLEKFKNQARQAYKQLKEIGVEVVEEDGSKPASY